LGAAISAEAGDALAVNPVVLRAGIEAGEEVLHDLGIHHGRGGLRCDLAEPLVGLHAVYTSRLHDDAKRRLVAGDRGGPGEELLHALPRALKGLGGELARRNALCGPKGLVHGGDDTLAVHVEPNPRGSHCQLAAAHDLLPFVGEIRH
jgi:hypothetical protein